METAAPGWRKLASCSFPFTEAGDAAWRRAKSVWGKGGGIVTVGVGRKGGTTVKNVNLLITEYIAVHLQCCCHANTLGVYFLNPREELSVPCSPAVPFEFAAATAATVVSVLENGGGVGEGGIRLHHQSSQMQSSERPFSARLSKNDTN